MAKRTDKSQKGIIAALKALGCTVVNTSQAGAGMADLIAILPDGRTVLLIECKTPGSVIFTPDEVKFIYQLVMPAYRIALTAEQVVEIVSNAIQGRD